MATSESADDGSETVAEWTHKNKRCMVVKLDMGHYCGYVRTAFSDAWHYDDFQGYPAGLIDIHGGLTYGVDGEGWLGFDFAHAGDRCVDETGDEWGRMPTIAGDQVWNLDSVKEEVEQLAEQVAAVETFAEQAVDRMGDA